MKLTRVHKELLTKLLRFGSQWEDAVRPQVATDMLRGGLIQHQGSGYSLTPKGTIVAEKLAAKRGTDG